MENLEKADKPQSEEQKIAQDQSEHSAPKDTESNIDTNESTNTPKNKQIEELENKLRACQEELIKYASEIQNIRKRYESQIEETKKYAIANIAKEILGVMDNLKMALQNNNQELVSLQKTIAGVELTKTQLEKVFTKFNIKKIEPKIGEPFDYELHHAVSRVQSNSQQENTIIHVMQIGYKIEDRLLRPALVSVSSESD